MSFQSLSQMMSRLSIQHTARSMRSFNQFASPSFQSIRKFSTETASETASGHPPSPSRLIMNYLTEHGPQTRRALFAKFGGASENAVLRSKKHLTLLLDNLTGSGRVLVKPPPMESRRASSLYLYEMRDYSRSFKKVSAIQRQVSKAKQAEKQAQHKARTEQITPTQQAVAQ